MHRRLEWERRMTVGIVTGAARGMGAACAARVADMVDVLLVVDRDGSSLTTQVESLAAAGTRADLEPFVLDVKDGAGITRLSARASELGPLRAVAHAAGVSPTMADWREILTINLVGTALLVDTCRALASPGTAMVCFASVAPLLALGPADLAADSVLDDPLAADFLERIREAVGPELEDPGMAYTWSKRGVHRLVRREAVRFGQVGARICSVTPGIIDTPMGRQEAAARDTNDMLVQLSPIGREGRAEEVAAGAAFLLSDEASFISGIDLPVDGGVVAAIRSGGVALA
jgi:NAD(P)-dependent dehydrogenase (short-subunit alcohol dehydrogenase family)